MTKLDFNGCTGKQPVCHTNQELVKLRNLLICFLERL